MLVLRTVAVSLAMLMCATLPSAAAKRTMHLLAQTYALDFSRDYVFVKRMNPPGSKRDTLLFQNGNKSIIVSASLYVAENAGRLMSREAYMAKMSSEKATAVKYVNEETADGRLGSHLLGGCGQGNCFYKMQSVVEQRLWFSVVVTCDKCSADDEKAVSKLADALYLQLKKI